ncbi:PiggyBac transposable element-derived protein 4-like 6 [Homarus americanus]|uniref:PiggyBac transposable element-derived protein 4-like 6 n=1 Tax=Homarus americanus TaxID=6706 RepID=A0A8J5NDL6_HOMAM|nr:PiggyBac transposable element-derived protein 4-like 6 [Homarus americanus]
MPVTNLSAEEKIRILTLMEEKVPLVEIVRRTGRGIATLHRLKAAARHLPPGQLPASKPRTGRPRKTTPDTDTLLRRDVLRSSRKSAAELKKAHPDLLGNVSERTIQHRLQNLNLPSGRKKRLSFSHKYKHRTVEQRSKDIDRTSLAQIRLREGVVPCIFDLKEKTSKTRKCARERDHTPPTVSGEPPSSVVPLTTDTVRQKVNFRWPNPRTLEKPHHSRDAQAAALLTINMVSTNSTVSVRGCGCCIYPAVIGYSAMPTSCIAFGCNERANKKSNPSITFHQLPKDPSRRQKWLLALRRHNYTPGKQARLCSKHFAPEDFDRTSLSCVRIRENAAPSIFEAFPAHLQIKTNTQNKKLPRTRTVCEPSPPEAAASTLTVAENHLEANLTNSPSKVMKRKLEEKLVKSRKTRRLKKTTVDLCSVTRVLKVKNLITGTCFKPIKEAEIYAVLQGSDPEYSDEDSIFEKTNDSDDEDDDFKRSDDEGEFMHSDKDEKYEEYLSNLESEIDSEASDDSATSSSTSPHKKRRLATDMEDLQFTYTEPLLQGDIGLRWSNKPVMETVPKPNRDIVNGIRSGPDGLATIADTPEQCLELFLDLDMINEIVIHTNSAISAISEKVSTKNATVEETSVDEIKALIGILIFSGCRRDNHLSTAEMWNTQVGSPLYQAAMSERRFSFLLECLCFDEAATRRERSKTDKLAPIRQLWNEFLTKCQKSYVPGETLTVGEQLLPFHGQCGFCVNFANKPAKYGIKLSVICDAKSKYMLNAIPYLRKDDYTPACQGLELRHITKELCKPYFNTWRNVTTESCFTSIPLSMDLLNNCGLTSVGDLRLNRPHIPPNMTRKDGRKENSSVFCFAEGLTMVSYMPYPQKLVVHLSTMHTQPTIDKNKRPEIINYYNRKKSAVDKFDQMTKQYSCSRKTNRWHLCMFYFIINAATINAWVISNNNKKTQQEVEQARGQFMQDLALRLVTPWAQKRIDSGNLGRRLQWTKKDMVKINVPKQSVPPSLPIAKRCGSCTGEEERKSQSVCIACYEPVCDLHSYITCLNCQ